MRKQKNKKKTNKKNTRHFELHSGKGDGRTGGKCTSAVKNGNLSVGPKLIMSNELLNDVSCHGSFKRKESRKRTRKKNKKRKIRRKIKGDKIIRKTVFKGLFRYQIKICNECFYLLCCRGLTYFNANVNNFSKN